MAAVARVGGLGGVVVHQPVPSPFEDPGGGLRVDRFPSRSGGQSGGAEGLSRVAVVPGRRAGTHQRLDVVAQRGAGGEGEVRSRCVNDIGVARVAGEGGGGARMNGYSGGSLQRGHRDDCGDRQCQCEQRRCGYLQSFPMIVHSPLMAHVALVPLVCTVTVTLGEHWSRIRAVRPVYEPRDRRTDALCPVCVGPFRGRVQIDTVVTKLM